nr:immunoglobulin light chain junction region [Macaca mulatta]MOX49001.1 immunoglobulin light chain junction region [Macaca mulatta]MOX50727.1 immunoglobulin light chain junction region [Macaca mulatta]
CQHYNDLLPTF